MNKTLKFLLLAFAVLLALLVAAVVYIAATFNPNDYKPRLIELVKEKTGRTLAVPGDIRLTFFPRLGAELGKISLSEAHSQQVFAAADKLHVSVALLPLLSGEMVVDRVLLDGLNLKLHRDRNGHYNYDDLLPSKDKEDAAASSDKTSQPDGRAMPRLDIGGVALTHASVAYLDDMERRQLKLVNINFVTGPITDGRKSDLDFSADLSGDNPQLALHLALSTKFTPRFDPPSAELQQLSASVRGSDAAHKDLLLKFDASTISASASKMSAQGLALEATQPNPAGGVMSFKAKGQANADLSAQSAHLTLDGALDSTTIALKADVKNFSHPAIGFDLALGELDADRYLPHGDKTPSPSASGGNAPESVIDLSPLRALDVHGSIKLAALKIMNLRASSLRMQIKAQGGQAEINPLTATLYGGGVNGAVSAAAGAPQRLAAKLDLRGVNIGPLLKDALNQQPLDGRGNLALNVTSEGKTVSQFKRSLNGAAGLQLQDGAINGVNIAGALRKAKAQLGGGSQATSSTAQEKTDFTELSASFKIKSGVAHNDDLSAKAPLLRLGGSGDVYIPEDRLDYTVKATVAPTLQGQGGPELEQLKGLTIPVHLSGPYTAVSWKVDFGGLASNRTKELIDQRKSQLQQDLQQRLREQADDRLKNLLRR